MKTEQLIWTEYEGWNNKPELTDAGFVIYFGEKGKLESGVRLEDLKSFYPRAIIIGCSTGGEIYNNEVMDNSLVVSAIKFDSTTLLAVSEKIESNTESFAAGKKIAKSLYKENLNNIFILSDGTNVNGSELVKGMYEMLDEKVIVTGGLAGDGADFKKTLVGLNNFISDKHIVAVGFYGDKLKVKHGSVGGWDAFGPERIITRSKDNILYELDNKPALDLYKKYLGEEAEKLPGSGLLFPLNIKPDPESKNSIVRTIVGINENDRSLIFAGDIPQGYISQLMQGNFNNLIEGAAQAAKITNIKNSKNVLAILVSCIGRKLLLGQQISDEVEAVSNVFQNIVPMIGFYSYGEICHQQFTNECMLHNQTMTITVMYES